MSKISELAVVDPAAQIGQNVRIGPFCVIGPDVTIGDGSELNNSVTIEGMTTIGKNNVFYPYSVVGVVPLDLKYQGEPTETIIGNSNVIREHVTIHRGTELGGGQTVIGNENILMTGMHVAHDCIVHNRTLIGNQVLLAGHVTVQDGAVISAMVGVHHFVRIGKYSYIGAKTAARRDVAPFLKTSGNPAKIRGVNTEGLSRNGFSQTDISEMKQAYKKLFRASRDGDTILSRLDELERENNSNEQVSYLCEFLRRSFTSPLGRAQETKRQDKPEDRVIRKPSELRKKS